MKIKNILTITLFSLILLSIFFASFIISDKDISTSERRKLAQFSSVTEESIFDSEFSEKLETYLLDQFPLRDGLRRINASTRYNVLGQKDVNGIWIQNGGIFKDEGALDEKQVLYGIGIINRLTDSLSDMNVYYSLIPDKNYFLENSKDHIRFDYDGFFKLVDENIGSANYIDVFDTLELDDYYKTDTHWSQDKLFKAVKKLAYGMGIVDKIVPQSDYTVNELEGFCGVYLGQSALNVPTDTLKYLTNSYTENAKVYGIDPEVLKNDFGVEDTLSDKVYALDRFFGIDGYDVFLSGAQPVVTMECENAKTDRELVIFRDSYGSSIAPLFLGAYKKVTLVDLRYIPSMLVSEYVDLKEGQDVLFLYSTMMINKAMTMK